MTFVLNDVFYEYYTASDADWLWLDTQGVPPVRHSEFSSLQKEEETGIANLSLCFLQAKLIMDIFVA